MAQPKVKFTEKYEVETCQIYKTFDDDKLIIPPEGHPLYDADGSRAFDELRVQEIDKDGEFNGIILVWTDVDRGAIYVVEGRGNVLDIREVNRRRRERGDTGKLVAYKFMPINQPVDRAVEHVVIRNFHRKRLPLAHYAREIVRLFDAGKPWERIAQLLHLSDADMDIDGSEEEPKRQKRREKWLRRVASLTYAIDEVAQAVEAGKISITRAQRFGGRAINGSEKLAAADQQVLLAEMLGGAAGNGVATKAQAPVPIRAKQRIAAALVDDSALEGIEDDDERQMAQVAGAMLSYLAGDTKALNAWPAIRAFVRAVEADDRRKGKGKGKKAEAEAAADAE